MKSIRYSIIGGVLLFMILGNSFLLFAQEPTLAFAACASKEVRSQLPDQVPFLTLTGPEQAGDNAILGQCSETDTPELLALLREEQHSGRLPSDIWFAFSNPDEKNICSLYALRVEKKDYSPGKGDLQSVELSGKQFPGGYSLILTFNGKGTGKWARMTGDHVGEYIAIVIDGKVVSAPRVMSAIEGGKCMISGDFSHEEAAGLKTSLGF
jgi:hypothetical protein